jgi:hypothetical protein
LVDRLGKQIVNDLLEDRRSGMTNLQLVERYSISLSSVKRILKRARGLSVVTLIPLGAFCCTAAGSSIKIIFLTVRRRPLPNVEEAP